MNGCDAQIVIDSGCPNHTQAILIGLTGFLRRVRVSSRSRYTSYRHARFGNGTLCIRPDAKVRNGKPTFSNPSVIRKYAVPSACASLQRGSFYVGQTHEVSKLAETVPCSVNGNREALSAKIAVAEAAVSHCARELTTTAWDIDEHLALRDAAFSLHLLKSQPANR
jgi:hypothetical protein